jgi:potassium intermediate/small conductance calcium-activated channel subfamily N protein 2
MKNDSWIILTSTMPVTLIAFSYQLRLFERHVNPASFQHITTAMWNMMITMLTIGYGDVYPKSHMGRLIGIVIASWGAFYVSLFVVALNNILEFDSPEKKSFMLLARLLYKEDLRLEAAKCLGAAYRLKLARAKAPEIRDEKEIIAQ